MKIESSQIQMAAARTASESLEREERLRAWDDRNGTSLEYESKERRVGLQATLAHHASTMTSGPALGGAHRVTGMPFPGQGRGPAELPPPFRGGVTISPQARVAQLQDPTPPVKTGEVEGSEEEAPEDLQSAELAILKAAVERLTGKKIELFDPKELNAEGADLDFEHPPAEGARPRGGEREGWGVRYDYHERYEESEQVNFEAQGVVRTADGREIRFTTELAMSRRFVSEQHISLRAGDALKDPLVINFNGSAAQLLDEKMAFDIDADGTSDQIALLAPSSAYLALDRDGNGQIDDGSELFGPQSGDGFADLSKLDDDGNLWIDENDAAYAKLLLWTPDADGAGTLESLAERNVGAIYLGRASTEFSLKDDANALQGQVRATGVYLNEDGGVGTIQQVDLVA